VQSVDTVDVIGRYALFLNLRHNGRGSFLKVAATVDEGDRMTVIVPDAAWEKFGEALAVIQESTASLL